MKKLLRYLFILFIGYYTTSQEINILIPILIIITWRARHKIIFKIRDYRGILFEGEDNLFKKNIRNIDLYGEYGMGDSTVWVFKNTKSKIISVDTDANWLKKVKSKIGVLENLDRLDLEWIDLGKISDWGTPKSYEKRNNIKNYLEYNSTTRLTLNSAGNSSKSGSRV